MPVCACDAAEYPDRDQVSAVRVAGESGTLDLRIRVVASDPTGTRAAWRPGARRVARESKKHRGNHPARLREGVDV
jgi:hypothetical protein